MNWKTTAVVGTITAVISIVCINNDLWWLAMVATIAFLVSGVMAVIKTNEAEKRRKLIREANRERVFAEWLKTASISGMMK